MNGNQSRDREGVGIHHQKDDREGVDGSLTLPALTEGEARRIKLGLVCSHGGHLAEMMELIDAFRDFDLFFVTYRGGRAQELAQTYHVYALGNIGYSPRRLLLALPAARRILRCECPQALVSTGSEIAIPFFVAAKALGVRTVFVESWCRVRSRSGTGRVLYPLADRFFVQWPQMVAVYGPKARYAGGLL